MSQSFYWGRYSARLPNEIVIVISGCDGRFDSVVNVVPNQDAL
jgi:hypothetical protein